MEVFAPRQIVYECLDVFGYIALRDYHKCELVMRKEASWIHSEGTHVLPILEVFKIRTIYVVHDLLIVEKELCWKDCIVRPLLQEVRIETTHINYECVAVAHGLHESSA